MHLGGKIMKGSGIVSTIPWWVENGRFWNSMYLSGRNIKDSGRVYTRTLIAIIWKVMQEYVPWWQKYGMFWKTMYLGGRNMEGSELVAEI